MATTTYKILGQSAPSATTSTDLYTVPSATEVIVSSIVVANRSTTAATYRISVAANGAALANEQYLVFDATISANETIALSLGITDLLDSLVAYTGEITDEQVACWETSNGSNQIKSCGAKTTDNATATHLLCKDDSGEIENCTLAGLAISGTTSPTITVEAMPANATVNAAGEMTIDTTTDQIRWYGTEQRQLSPKLTFSVVVPSVADTDDMLIMKAPYGMTITALDCIVSAATSATINIQECDSAGANCVDTATSDLACDTDGANTTTLNNAAVDSGDWLKLDVASISGTPGTLTVTVTYTIVAD